MGPREDNEDKKAAIIYDLALTQFVIPGHTQKDRDWVPIL